MPHPLDSARLKLDRAREHIDTIRAETIPYMAQDPRPYGMRGDKDPETRDKLIVLEARVPLPARWGIIAAEAAAADRSALNYLVCELVILNGKTPNRNQFPIFTDPAKYKGERSRYLTGIRDDLRDRFDDLQPPSGQDRHPLALLQWMNNVDKHTNLHAIYVLPYKHSVKAYLTRPDPETTIEFLGAAEGSPVDDGAVLYKIRTRPDPTVEVKVEATVELLIAFGERAVTMPELAQIEAHVRSILDSFDDVF